MAPHQFTAKIVPTIKQVAEAAQVSRATVSRAFGASHLLSRETVARVRAAAEELGYVPNHTARALSTGRAGNIALVVPDITNAFFAALMRGAQARAWCEGYATFLGDSDETPELEDVLLQKLAAQVDGFVLVSSRLAEDRIRHHAARRPFVLVNRDIAGLSRLLIDTGPSYGRAVDHLADLGHRRIAYVSGPDLSWSNGQRAQAVAKAARRHGIELFEPHACRPSFEGGQACAALLLAAGVTAALAFDDVVAQGLMAGLAERSVTVPRDFSVVGCDGVIAPTLYPPLTSIAVQCGSVGEQAVDLLVALLGGMAPEAQRIDVPAELVVRGTTAPARPASLGQRTKQPAMARAMRIGVGG